MSEYRPLEIQEFLRGRNDAIESLKKTYGVTAKRHSRHSNLVLLRYNQYESPLGIKMVQQCRGIILDSYRDWTIVARAYDKFFNRGEKEAATIDWGTARVQEKIDGSLIVLYGYDGKWHVATGGMPDGSGVVHANQETFACYFRETLEQYPNACGQWLPNVECGLCFFFELTGPKNRLVVVKEEAGLTLLGARDMRTQEEMTAIQASGYFPNIPIPTEYMLKEWEIDASFDMMSPLSQEGYVIVDSQFNRIKVKHPGYVALHHAKDGMGPRAFIEIARTGEEGEILATFPEYRPLVEDAKRKIDMLVHELLYWYCHYHGCGYGSDKEYAEAVRGSKYATAMFFLRKNPDVTAMQYVREMPIEKLMRLLDNG